jgi:hypothetical protein
MARNPLRRPGDRTALDARRIVLDAAEIPLSQRRACETSTGASYGRKRAWSGCMSRAFSPFSFSGGC